MDLGRRLVDLKLKYLIYSQKREVVMQKSYSRRATTGFHRILAGFRHLSTREGARAVAFGVAIIIGLILVVAAYGKLFYPAEFLTTFERWVSVVELLFLGALFFFRKHWQMWVGAAIIFAAWCGYALFWYLLKLPCNCMGAMLSIPTAFLITLDFVLFASSLIVAYLLKAKRRYIYLSILSGLFAALIGFGLAEWIYRSFV